MPWKLSRPEPALPNSFFWTWDHSTNWVLDDPGILNFGCYNRYLKQPETFIEDYRRLTEFAAGLGIKGITIYGFLRDSHGGVEAAKRVASDAASKGVAVMPGVGTTWYGGCYYEGDHPYNLETFVRKNPGVRLVKGEGERQHRESIEGVCPTNPLFREWIQEGTEWLFDTFEIGGANIENGDFVVCHDPGCRAHQASWPEDDPDFFRLQALSYEPALDRIRGLLRDKLVTVATYTGFVPGGRVDDKPRHMTPCMHCKRPKMIDSLPPEGVFQWTLSGMVLEKPLPLTAYLDNGAPDEVFKNLGWPVDLRPPSSRSVGLLHQPSQWCRTSRYEQGVSSIKEACLRAYRSGLEGVSILGEVSAAHIPAALNYLAFSHFIHWPEDSLLNFGQKTLGQVFDDAEEGTTFVEIFAHWDAGALTDSHKKEANSRCSELMGQVRTGKGLKRWRFWHWLTGMVRGTVERHTVHFF